MPLSIICQDIVPLEVDAIVNAANTRLAMGGGVCGAIFRAAGAAQMQAACDRLAPICTGGAVITPGFGLRAPYVIHAVGPVYDPERAQQCERLLRSAYTESLKLAAEHALHSIAFPLISSGIYGYPREAALRVALSAIGGFLTGYEMEVYLAVLDPETFALGKALAGEKEGLAPCGERACGCGGGRSAR